MTPALAGGFLSTVPPGKSFYWVLKCSHQPLRKPCPDQTVISSLFSHPCKPTHCFLSQCGGGGSVTKSCLTLRTPWTVARHVPLSMVFPRQGAGVGSHFLLQGIFLTQDLNPCPLHCTTYRFSSDSINHQVALVVKNSLPMQTTQETQAPSLSQKDSLEEETHSSVLDWRIPGQRSLTLYSPWDCKESEMIEVA